MLLAPVVFMSAGCQQPPFKPPQPSRTFLSAETLANRLGLKLTKQTESYALMSNAHATIQIFAGPKGYIYVNGKVYGQADNAIYKHGKIWVLAAREEFLRIELRRLMPKTPKPTEPPPRLQPRKPFSATIVVDAGHGGKDPGAQGISSVPEKTIVLDIAQRLAGELRSRGAKVTMTRDGDRFLELSDRANIAERTRADVFISIHANSAQRRSADGLDLFISRSASTESRRIARSIELAMRAAGLNVNGVQTAGFKVLVGHSRPAVLVETGYLTNSGDVARLNSATYREKVANAIAEGLADHFTK